MWADRVNKIFSWADLVICRLIIVPVQFLDMQIQLIPEKLTDLLAKNSSVKEVPQESKWDFFPIRRGIQRDEQSCS